MDEYTIYAEVKAGTINLNDYVGTLVGFGKNGTARQYVIKGVTLVIRFNHDGSTTLI